MKLKMRNAVILLLGLVLGAIAVVSIDVAWAQTFSTTRRLRILNVAGTGEIDVQEGTTGFPVTVLTSPATMPIWTASQNKTLAQCGVGETALDTATSKSVIIKPDQNATDNVWCNVGGTVDVEVGFRVGLNGEGLSIGIADPADIECCGEGAATFKISVTVEN